MTLKPTSMAVDGNQETNRHVNPLIAERIGGVSGNSKARLLCAPPAQQLDLNRLLHVRTQCDSCESSTYIETPVHAGASLRRDCALCNRFLGWPVWYGRRLEDN